jgi:spore coat protein U-like protein
LNRAALIIRCALFAAAIVLLLPQAASANIRNCTVDVNLLAFGTFSGSRIDTTNRITLTCNGTGNNNAYSVALSEGGSNTFLDRVMFNGLNELHYNLYTDAAHTLIWGNARGQTVVDVGDFDFRFNIGDLTQTLTVYGQVPAQAVPAAGTYTDLILVTVIF